MQTVQALNTAVGELVLLEHRITFATLLDIADGPGRATLTEKNCMPAPTHPLSVYRAGILTDKAKLIKDGALILPTKGYAASVYGQLQARSEWVRLDKQIVIPFNEFFHAPGALDIGSDLPKELLDEYYGAPGRRYFHRNHSLPAITAYVTNDEIRGILERDGFASDGRIEIAKLEELLR